MKDLLAAIVNIFKYAGKFITIIRNTVLNLLFLCLIVFLVFSFFSSKKAADVTIKKNSILRLDLYGNIVEERRIPSSVEQLLEDPLLGGQSRPQETLLQDIVDVINASSTDDEIEVILLNLSKMGRAGLNQLETIGEALNTFKKTGKKVIAKEDYYTQSQYLLASYADTVIINPMGGVDIHGLGVYRLYFKDAIDKLKVNYNIFKVGTYKSALEPLTRTDMSSQDEQQNEIWLSKLWQGYSDRVIQNRNMNSFQLRRYTNNVAEELKRVHGNTAQLALTSGLVDKILTRSQVKEHLKNLVGSQGNSLPVTSTKTYLSSITPSYAPDSNSEQNIGVIIAEGNILPGKQPTGMIGGDSLSILIDKARTDKNIKGLVLRINSGGGSAFASEIIRQTIIEYKKSGKPIVVSMGTVAASGGYWIAADADEIWAESSTITGSIGIFGAIPTFEESLKSLGIYSDGIGTTPLASGLDITRPLAEPIKDSIQQTIEYNYRQFLDIVAMGRNLNIDDVERLAEGRVYDGSTAQELGLVDNLGSLDQAIGAAAKLAKLTEAKARYIQKPHTVKDQLLQYLSMTLAFLNPKIDSHIFTKIQNIIHQNITQVFTLTDPSGVYAICEIKPYFK
ncbi:signal peptide peptidase SppA [Desulforhopalus sp. 52FAK]